ncbi:MAG: FKBP-type peptidyl-prolyl cis-trans isomerase [Minisyncoccota bacterium]
MKNKINTTIAVAASLIVMGFLFYGNLFVGLFNPSSLDNNNPNMITTGVEKEDLVVGNGALASAGDEVTVHYVGTLSDGKVFDSSRDRGEPFTFTLGSGQVIRGWDDGVAGMRVGGTRRLTIAPDYGYGDRAVGPIPPNSVLIFEVELLGVKKTTQ